MESVRKSERLSTFQVLSHISMLLEQNIYCAFHSINSSFFLLRAVVFIKEDAWPISADLRNPKANLALTEQRREHSGLLFPTCSVEARC